MLTASGAVEHEGYNGFGMDAAVRNLSNMDVIMAWAWMLGSLESLKHER